MTERWIRLSNDAVEADPLLGSAIALFEAPANPAGDSASAWLKDRALAEADHLATWLLVDEETNLLRAFYALRMASVELTQRQRVPLGAVTPTQGAALICWLARGREVALDGELIVSHAAVIARAAGWYAGAVCIAADPYDQAAEGFWIERCEFRRSRTAHTGADGAELKRLYLPL